MYYFSLCTIGEYLHANEDDSRPKVSSWQRDPLRLSSTDILIELTVRWTRAGAPYCFRWLSLDLMAQLNAVQNWSLTRPGFWGLKACRQTRRYSYQKKRPTTWSAAIIFHQWNSANWHSIYAGHLILFMWRQPRTAPGHLGARHPGVQDVSQQGMANKGKDICYDIPAQLTRWQLTH